MEPATGGDSRIEGFMHVETVGIEQMHAEFSRLVRSHDVTLTDPRDDFVSELHYARLTRSMLSTATVRASMNVSASPAYGFCLLLSPMDQPLDMRIDRRRVTIPVGSFDIVPPNVPFELYIPPGESRSIMLDVELGLLEAIVARDLCRDLAEPLRFGDGGGTHDLGARSFVNLLGFIRQELLRGAPQCRNRAHVARLEEMIASALLYTREHNYSGRLAALAHVAEPKFVRRAEDFIQAHAGEDLTLAEIAAIAAVSPRTLARGFRRYKHCSPMAYLRSVRLERCHRELRDTPPGDASVLAIAARWGFSNPGRFARLYRERFGEFPAQTLQRRH
jgi:AraC-like DNA-binding protein